MNVVQDRFINFELSHQLKLFKKTGEGIYNFRCPLCGDSKKIKSKTRGYLLSSNDNFFYKCHNCDCTTSFLNFLQLIDKSLYRKYLKETITNKSDFHSRKVEKEQANKLKI
jgi:predicted RNA-binding Zn-ribbon protein involved in translation (DUF1610 family)